MKQKQIGNWSSSHKERTDCLASLIWEFKLHTCSFTHEHVWACLLASAAQQAAQYKEKASLAENNLADAEKKLQSCVFQDKQKANTIQEQQMELQELQKELLQNKEDLSHNRYLWLTSEVWLWAWEPARTTERGQKSRDSPRSQLHLTTWALKSIFRLPLCLRKQVEELTSQLGEALRKFEHADKERRQLQRTLAEEEAKINEMQDQIRQLQHQVCRANRQPGVASALHKSNVFVFIWEDVTTESMQACYLGSVSECYTSHSAAAPISRVKHNNNQKTHCSFWYPKAILIGQFKVFDLWNSLLVLF